MANKSSARGFFGVLLVMHSLLAVRSLLISVCFFSCMFLFVPSFAVADEVGTISAEFNVSPDGDATYVVPVNVPPGIAGMQPQLSISYSGRKTGGHLGVGWSLNGLSTIHRCSATLAQDGFNGGINYDRFDRFCMDGMRLIKDSVWPQVINNPDLDNYQWNFKKEIWDVAEITGVGITGAVSSVGDAGSGPKWFKVRTKDGMIMEYGNTSDSRIEIQDGTDVRVWLLNRVEDTNGNYMLISYNEINASGEYYPTRIDYTGNTRTGKLPSRSVLFEYDKVEQTPGNAQSRFRRDTEVGYVGGVQVRTAARLDVIKTQINDQAIREYRLGYEQSISSGRTRLNKIIECGRLFDDPSSEFKCLPSTDFKWQDGGGAGLGGAILPTDDPITDSHSGLHAGFLLLMADVNGDGIKDAVFRKKTSGELYIYLVKNGRLQAEEQYYIANVDSGYEMYAGNYSAEQRSELLFYHAESGAFSIRGLDNGQLITLSFGAPSSQNGFTQKSVIYSGNFDANFWESGNRNAGIDDLLLWDSVNAGFYIKAVSPDGVPDTLELRSYLPSEPDNLSPGCYFRDIHYQGETYIIPSSKCNDDDMFKFQYPDDYKYSALYIGEFNGDGILDALFWHKDIGRLKLHTIENGQLQPVSESRESYYANHELHVADFNGDGLSDLGFFDENSGVFTIVPIVLTKIQSPSGSFNVGANAKIASADFDGDGDSDISAWSNESGGFNVFRIRDGDLDQVKNDDSDPWNNFYFNGGGSFVVMETVVDGPVTTTHEGLLGSRTDVVVEKSVDPETDATTTITTVTTKKENPIEETTDVTTTVTTEIPLAGGTGLFPSDNNGDIRADGIFRDYRTGALMFISGAGSGGFPDVINKITDSLKSEINIAYKPLTDRSVYAKDSSANYPVIDLQGAKNVVSEYSVSNGLGGFNVFSYFYRGSKKHAEGRGYLGFRQVEVLNHQSDFVTKTSYRQDFPFTGRIDTLEMLLNGVQIQHVQNEWLSSSGSQIGAFYLPFLSRSVESKNDITGQLVTSITTQTMLNGWGKVDYIWEHTTDGAGVMTYSKYLDNQYYPDSYSFSDQRIELGKLAKTTVSYSSPKQWSEAPDSPLDTKVSSYSYYDNGLLKSEVIEPDDVNNLLTTSYEYDDYGNRIKAVTTGNDIEPRTIEMNYTGHVNSEHDGYFLYSKSVDAGGGVKHTEYVNDYDERYGLPTRSTDINGLETSWLYDEFGRVKAVDQPDMSDTLISFGWCSQSSSCPEKGVYYKQEAQAAEPIKTTYYDGVQRDIRSETEGFDGQIIRQDKEYDSRGLLFKVSNPYFSNEIPLYWKIYEYDNLNRLSRTTSSNGSVTEISYDGLKTTTVVDLGGKNLESVSWNNALGKLIKVRDSGGNEQFYDYDKFSNLIYVKDPLGNVTISEYDIRGRKISMSDPDMGGWQYQYYSTGELKWQRDAKGQEVAMKYDRLGRLTERTEPEGTTKWFYDTAQMGVGTDTAIGQLAYMQNPNGTSRTHAYDSLARPKQMTVNMGMVEENASYTVETAYDDFSRVSTVKYPTGFTVENNYNTRGYQVSVIDITDTANPRELWRAENYTASMQIGVQRYGNGVTTEMSYFPDTNAIQNIKTNNGAIQDLWYEYDNVGNVKWRQDTRHAVKESFCYDNMNRLSRARLGNETIDCINGADDFMYDAVGNVTYKQGVGYYHYKSDKPHAVTDVTPDPASMGPVVMGDANGDGQINALDNSATIAHILGSANAAGQPDCVSDTFINVLDVSCINSIISQSGGSLNSLHYDYDDNGNMINGGGRTVSYTSFNKAERVTAGGSTLEFIYDGDHNRLRQIGSDRSISYLKPYYEKSTTDTLTEHTHYISAGGSVIGAYIERSSNDNDTFYYHKDHLGSINVITSTERGIDNSVTAALKDEFSFDAFGKRRQLSWQDGVPAPPSPIITSLGFTGHEQLDSVGLVHMNARLYDPVLARFLSADSVTQFPGSTQGFNRYTYVNNNPLLFVDPTGHFFNAFDFILPGFSFLFRATEYLYKQRERIGTIALGIALSTISPYLSGFIMGVMDGGDIRSGIVGAFSAGMFGVIGDIGSTWNIAGKMVAHGLAGGVQAKMSGGSFRDGFISAAATQGMSGVIGNNKWLSNNRSSQVFAAAVVGGAASKLSGGKFSQGAMTGAFSHLFNELSHNVQQKKTLRRVFEDGSLVTKTDKIGEPVWGGIGGLGGLAKVISKTIGRIIPVEFQFQTQLYGEYELVQEFTVDVTYRVNYEDGWDFSSKIVKIGSPRATGAPKWRYTGRVSHSEITGFRGCPINCSVAFQ